MAQTLDAPKSTLDNSVEVFDQFYNVRMNVNGPDYDIVYSYFKDITGSTNIAKNFTTFLFRISNISGTHVQELLDNMKGKNKLELNLILAYYLNGIKSKTALYGVGMVPQPNQSVQRNIII